MPCIKDETDNKNWGLNIMKLRKLTVVLASLGLASVALAGEEIKTRMAIALVDGDSHGEVRLELDSDDLGFNLHDMQEGENQSIVDKLGRTILVTREADGYRFDGCGGYQDLRNRGGIFEPRGCGVLHKEQFRFE